MTNDNTNSGAPRRLSGIVKSSEDALRDLWESTTPAKGFQPLPPGEYIARIVSGERTVARTGTQGYKLTFVVLDGEHTGRRFWHDLWMTDKALARTMRDLAPLGITEFKQLKQPLPPGIRCKARLTIRQSDSGATYNRVTSFEVTGIDSVDLDADFAPAEGGDR